MGTIENSYNFDKKSTRSEILASWQRSKKYGLSPDTVLAEPTFGKKAEVAEKITDRMRFLWKHLYEFYLNLENLVREMEAAILYLNSDMEIFRRDGDPQLLKDLRQKNIRFGINLSEKNAGTNAAALSNVTKKIIWVEGDEHYLDVFKDYSMIAMPQVSNPFYHVDCFVLVLPCSKMTPHIKTFFNFAIEQFKMLTNYRYLPDVFIKNMVLSEIMAQKASLYIITDNQGLIIEANDEFYTVFKTTVQQITGKRINKVFPELAFSIKALKTGKETKFRNITFENLPEGQGEYIADVTPVSKENQNLFGMVIILTNRKKLLKYINKVTDSRPHFTFDLLIGGAPLFTRVKELARQAASGPSTVLIIGESGTGKDLFAQAIHNDSKRRENPFIPLNCAAIPKELIGSELFGYVDGAFTGAKKGGAQGKFEMADGGTLFLDEIAEMPLDMQAVLLRVLEDHTVTRIGSSKPIAIDVRIIAATNRNLKEYVKEGKFRLDLYFRLNVVELTLPPLRDRKEDIPLLVNYFLQNFSESFGKNISGVTPDVMRLLTDYNWPGNLRQLRNIIERGVNASHKSVLTVGDLSQELTAAKHSKIDEFEEFTSYEDYEKVQIRKLLIANKGNKSAVAAAMGISRKSLYNKLRKLGF